MKKMPQGGDTFDLLEEETIIEPQVEWSGFSQVDPTQREGMDKMVSNHLKRLAGHCENIEVLRLTMKGVHKGRKNKKIELHGKLIGNGKSYTAEVVEFDLLVGLDKALRKLEHAVAK